METWRPMAGFEATHSISSLGRIRAEERVVPNSARGVRTVKQRILKTYRHTGGYVAIKLSVGHERHHCYVHRLVCETWHGAEPAGCEVLHRDGRKTNNKPKNLRWGTRFENLADNARHGIKPIGETHGMAKLKAAQVLEIRADSREYADIAKDFGVSRAMIGMIKNRRSWKHI